MKTVLTLGLAAAVLAGGAGAAGARPLFPDEGRSSGPLLSSSLLTFVTSRTGVQTIVSRAVDGGPLREIVAGDQPQWSPNGTKLLYVVHPDERSDLNELHVMDVDGTNAHIVGSGTGPSWSPDSTKIAFRDPTGRIVIVAAASGRVLRIVRQPVRAVSFFPIWSPDGRWLAFVEEGGVTSSSLMLVHPDGTGLHGIAESVNTPTGSWSPDGTKLAYTPLAGGTAVYTLRTGRVRTLALVGTPLWSPDGRWLAAASYDTRTLAVVRADGTQLHTIATNAAGYEIAWSPDSQSLAMPVAGYPTDVWVVALDGSSHAVSEGERYGYRNESPSWAPAAAATLGQVVSPALPSDSRVDGDTLRSRWPITHLAADGSRVAVSLQPSTGLVPGCTDIWTAGDAAVARMPECEGASNAGGVSASSGAFAGARLWVQSGTHELGTNIYRIDLSTLEHPGPVPVDGVCANESGSGCFETPVGDLVADDSLAVFDGWRGPQFWCNAAPCPPAKKNGVLYRIDGTHAVAIATADDGLELTPLAVDGDRILVDRGAGGLSVYDRDGNRQLTLPLTNVTEGALAGDDLVAHTAAGLQIFDSQSGAARRTCAVPDGAHFDGAAAGLALVATSDATDVVRLTDCRTITIGGAPAHADLARVTTSGVFAVHSTGDSTYPFEVAFTPTSDVIRTFAP